MTGLLHIPKAGGESPRSRLSPRLSGSTTCWLPPERFALHDMFALQR